MEERDIVVGIRPENINISEEGAIEALAYSTLPAGMETTVKAKVDDTLLSSDVFGAVDFAIDQTIRFNVVGKQICIFEDQTTSLIAQGSISLN